MPLVDMTKPSFIDWVLFVTFWVVLFCTAYHLLWGKRIAKEKTQQPFPSGRHRYARASVTEELKGKLIDRLQQEQNLELLADDLIEVIAVARNDPDGFRAANRELDRLANFDSSKS